MRALVFWVAVATLVLYGSLAYMTTYLTDNTRSGCNRANVARQSDFDNWNAASKTRKLTGLTAPPGSELRRVSLKGAREYEQNAKLPVFANERAGVALRNGSPQVNCGVAYPYPLPWVNQ